MLSIVRSKAFKFPRKIPTYYKGELSNEQRDLFGSIPLVNNSNLDVTLRSHLAGIKYVHLGDFFTLLKAFKQYLLEFRKRDKCIIYSMDDSSGNLLLPLHRTTALHGSYMFDPTDFSSVGKPLLFTSYDNGYFLLSDCGEIVSKYHDTLLLDIGDGKVLLMASTNKIDRSINYQIVTIEEAREIYRVRYTNADDIIDTALYRMLHL